MKKPENCENWDYSCGVFLYFCEKMGRMGRDAPDRLTKLQSKVGIEVWILYILQIQAQGVLVPWM